MTGPVANGPPEERSTSDRVLGTVRREWRAAGARTRPLLRLIERRARSAGVRAWLLLRLVGRRLRAVGARTGPLLGLVGRRVRAAGARTGPLLGLVGRRVRAAGARTGLLPGAVRAGFVESWRRRQARRRATGAAIVARRDDDLASIIGRIDTATEIELVLIVPRAARRLRTPGVWPRLSAHVRRRGIALAVVAARRDVRYQARASGFHAVRSLRGLRPLLRVRVGAREFDLPAVRPGRVLRWLVPPALLVAASVSACYVVPSAEVVIVPPAESFTRSVTVRIDPVAETPDIDLGLVPGLTVRRTVITVLATETTGNTEVGDERATLELLISNDGDAPVRVAADTLIANETGVSFSTADAITVPTGESLTVMAAAERAGTVGNVEAEQVWAMSGVPETLRVDNPRPAAGGTDVSVPAVAVEDGDRLRAIATEVLARVGAGELERTVEAGTMFPETVTVAVFSREPLTQVGEPADMLLMEVTAVVSALVAPDEQVQAYGEALLIFELPDGVALLPGATTAELVRQPRLDNAELLVELTVTGLVAELFDPSTVREDLTGARPAAAAAALQQRLGLAVEPQITIEPRWLPWRWLPRRGDRISIRFAGPSAVGDSPVEETRAP